MARNGSGTFALLANLATANTVSSSTSVNATMDDVATALTESINVDGTKAFEANQSVGGFKFTSLGSGSARTDSINMGQAQDGKANWVAAGGTADVITATYSPAITALVDGQECTFRASAANTSTTPTFSPNGLTARTIVKNGGSALAAGDIAAAGHEVVLKYLLASTRWELLNPAIPAAVAAITAASTTEVLTGTDTDKFVTANSLAATWEKGSNVASATTTAFGEGGYVHITGTTTITDLDFTTAKDGRGIKVQFDGILTLTHNSTTLVLPGGANITTAAGDTAEFVQDSSDNIKCLWYQRASGQPLVASPNTGMTLLGTIDTSSGASASITSLTLTSYKALYVVFVTVSSSSDATFLIGNSTSDDVVITSTLGSAASTMTATAMIELSTGIGSSVSQSNGAGSATTLLFDTALSTSSTAVSVAPSAGNLDAGSVLVYGMR